MSWRRGCPPAKELTTDPDRALALAPTLPAASNRLAARAALAGDRDAVVVALAREQDAAQQADRRRLATRQRRRGSSRPSFGSRTPNAAFPGNMTGVVALAEQLLPPFVPAAEDTDADAQ